MNDSLWYNGCGEHSVMVERTLNNLAYESAGKTFTCRAEISWEMAEAIWAKYVGLA